MTTMKLGEYDAGYSAGGNFSFPNNPFDVLTSMSTRKKAVVLPYKSIHPFLDFGTAGPAKITLRGTMYGASRDTNFRNFTKKFWSKNLKRFWISDSRFAYCYGEKLNGPSMTGRKNNFNDYTAVLFCPIPFWYDSTAQTYEVTGVGSGATTLNDNTANSTDAFENSGTAPAHIYHVEVECTNGTITGIDVGDKAKDGTSADGDNIISWTDGTGISAGSPNDKMHFYLFYHVGQKVQKWYYFKNSADSSSYGTRDLGGDNLEDGPRVSSGATNQDFSVKITGTGTPTASLTFTWYEADWVK